MSRVLRKPEALKKESVFALAGESPDAAAAAGQAHLGGGIAGDVVCIADPAFQRLVDLEGADDLHFAARLAVGRGALDVNDVLHCVGKQGSRHGQSEVDAAGVGGGPGKDVCDIRGRLGDGCRTVAMVGCVAQRSQAEQS